ncbi:ATP-binding protein [Piscinibacter sakaiensis]|nr:ATP-binding protein [Piscinibacter sakaiensis]
MLSTPVERRWRAVLSRPGALLGSLLLLFALAGAGALWLQAERSRDVQREEALLRAEQRAEQLAAAIAVQAGDLLGSIDAALLELREAWDGDAAGFGTTVGPLVAVLPSGAVSHVAVAEADGRTVYSSRAPSARVDVSDREHFQVQQRRWPEDRLHIGLPVQSRLGGGRWVTTLNRPLPAEGGRFGGTVNVIVPTDYFAAQLSALQLDAHDIVALVRADGSFIARSRDNERAMGVRLPASRPFLQSRERSGRFRATAEVDGVQRLFAWQRVSDTGLVAVVGLAEEDALAPLMAGRQRERTVLGVLLAVGALALLAIGVLLWQADRRQRALERGERRYRALVDSAPVAIFVTRHSRFVYLNPAALALLGAERPEQLIGRPVLERIHPDCHDAVRERRKRLLEDVEPVPPNAERYLRLDGSEVDVEVTASPYIDADGLGTQVVLRDIGEQLRASRAQERLAQELEHRVAERTADLAAARDEAERANRAKSEFLSRMSHELRTPLNAILGFGQLLEQALAERTGERAQVRQVLGAGQHLLTLINEVLDLARVEAGHLAVSTEPVALQALVADCMDLLRPQAQARGLSLSLPAADDRRQVRADRTRLKQVLINLLGNAIKYNRRGGSVAVRIEDRGEAWRVRVDDSGPGLDAAQCARLFVPFERLGVADGAVEGTGIGLALSRRLVELMHGTIGVFSEPGQGSSFWVDLPKAEDAVPPALPEPAPPAPAALAAGADDGTTLGLLCIEDNPANLMLVQHVAALRPRWRVQGAALPSAGLELARRQRPRLVLLDLHLPEMDGWSVLRVLREDPALRSLPVVAISAHAMPADIERGKAAGFDDYLTKPIDVTRLLALLDRYAR